MAVDALLAPLATGAGPWPWEICVVLACWYSLSRDLDCSLFGYSQPVGREDMLADFSAMRRRRGNDDGGDQHKLIQRSRSLLD